MKRLLILCALCGVTGLGSIIVWSQGSSGNAVGTAAQVDEKNLTISDQANTSPIKASGSNTIGYFIRMLLILAIVLGVLYLLYRLLRKSLKPKIAEDGAIRVLSSCSLGPGKSILVINLGTKAYLIGSSEAGVRLLSEIEDKALIDELLLKASQNPPSEGKRDFGDILANLLTNKNHKAQQRGQSQSFLARERARLKKF